MSSFIGQDQIKKEKKKEKKLKIYKQRQLKAQKGWAQTGHSDPCGVSTLGNNKDLKYIQKVKSSCSKRKV